MMLADIGKSSTVLALLAGSAASFVGVLLTLGDLLANEMMPSCDAGNPDRVAAVCDIDAVDYTRALPSAAVTLVVALLTVVLCRRVLRHERETRRPSRSVRMQIGIAVTLPAVALLGLVAMVVSPVIDL